MIKGIVAGHIIRVPKQAIVAADRPDIGSGAVRTRLGNRQTATGRPPGHPAVRIVTTGAAQPVSGKSPPGGDRLKWIGQQIKVESNNIVAVVVIGAFAVKPAETSG